jgi:DNA-binding CsgD family transcriptional regulator
MIEQGLQHTARLIGLFGASSNGNELCRRLASDDVFGPGTLGAQLYVLTNAGCWRLLGSFGKIAYDDQKLSQFDENLLTVAARSRNVETIEIEVDSETTQATACVLIRDNLPVGVWMRITKPGTFVFNPITSILKAIQDAGGLFLDSIGVKTVVASESAEDASPEEMTERQLQTLIDMAHGKTNLVIAQEVILSESTIKQESVKIFRALGVSTRQQAVLKAKTLGLLPDGIEIRV